VVAAGQAHNKILGAPAMDASLMQKYREQGFLFFQSTTELNLMARGARLVLDPMGKLAAEPSPRALY